MALQRLVALIRLIGCSSVLPPANQELLAPDGDQRANGDQRAKGASENTVGGREAHV